LLRGLISLFTYTTQQTSTSQLYHSFNHSTPILQLE
jgi:hypothetical protein